MIRVVLIALLSICSMGRGALIYPKILKDPLIYGVENGIAIAVYPAALDRRPQGGPRGVLRVGYQENGKFFLINYIAVEPVVAGRRSYSELENSADGRPGKQLTIGEKDNLPRIDGQPGHQSMTFTIHVEPFESGAAPIIEATLFEDHPDRVRFRTFSAPGGKAMQQCILTATMGNQSRCRWLWLADKPVHARDLYGDYSGNWFISKDPYPASQLHRTQDGDVVVAISPDEFEPREVWPVPNWDIWHHEGKWLAQYWLKRAGTDDPSLQCIVNGRRTYWASDLPLPGGIAYENFELNESFRNGEECWFGFTDKTPTAQFGFSYDAAPSAAPSRGIDNDPIAKALTETHLKLGPRKSADPARISRTFTIPPRATELQFTVRGEIDREALYVALWDGQSLYRKTTGNDTDRPFQVRWDIRSLRGKPVTLELIDNKLGARSYIDIEYIKILIDVDQ